MTELQWFMRHITREDKKALKNAFQAIDSGYVNCRDNNFYHGNRLVSLWYILTAMKLRSSEVTFILPNKEEYKVTSEDVELGSISEEDILWKYFLASNKDPWSECYNAPRYFHASWGINRNSILKKGLIPQGGGKTYYFSNSGVVCFSPYKITCCEMVEESILYGCSTEEQQDSGVVLFEISPWWAYFFQGKIRPDNNDRTGGSYQFKGKIPPEAIREVK